MEHIIFMNTSMKALCILVGFWQERWQDQPYIQNEVHSLVTVPDQQVVKWHALNYERWQLSAFESLASCNKRHMLLPWWKMLQSKIFTLCQSSRQGWRMQAWQWWREKAFPKPSWWKAIPGLDTYPPYLQHELPIVNLQNICMGHYTVS